MIRFATIGSNFIVHSFLEATAFVTDFKYVAAYSRSEDTALELAKKYGAADVYTDFSKLANSELVDAVYVASPNSLHFEQALLLINNKKHVLCEKPLVSNMREYQILEKAAQANGVVLMEAMKSVHCPGFAAVLENLPKLGIIRSVNFNFSQYSSRYNKFKQGIVENAFDPSFSNGALMDIGVYPLHTTLAVFGRPNDVKASAIKLPESIDVSGTLLLSYDTFIATILYSKVSSHEGNQIQGENATMLIDKISDIQNIEIRYHDGRVEKIEVAKGATMSYEIIKFVTAICGEINDDILATTRLQMEMLDTIREQLQIVYPADLVEDRN